ncbi:hypothetical protein K402DRAFT_402983 [Aulographum hederae CBS 113979]|uniref:Uncharacterized protein n=1 Tax=Aulographum hederae CBS 113979 TaxID=1176131 RepID=A0A6G1H5G4_9PEZI|nr:hypothetical protein K402DRAFT_402983 [Aulographum hederae CBS 113979]
MSCYAPSGVISALNPKNYSFLDAEIAMLPLTQSFYAPSGVISSSNPKNYPLLDDEIVEQPTLQSFRAPSRMLPAASPKKRNLHAHGRASSSQHRIHKNYRRINPRRIINPDIAQLVARTEALNLRNKVLEDQDRTRDLEVQQLKKQLEEAKKEEGDKGMGGPADSLA